MLKAISRNSLSKSTVRFRRTELLSESIITHYIENDNGFLNLGLGISAACSCVPEDLQINLSTITTNTDRRMERKEYDQ